MLRDVFWVEGWEIHLRPDNGYGVYDSHGLIAGPFGTKGEAITAAMGLPKHPTEGSRQTGQRGPDARA